MHILSSTKADPPTDSDALSTPAKSVVITLVRHGQTEFNAQQRVQGSLDTVLAENGLQQAEQLAQALREQQFDGLYCSDLTRTRQTIAPYARLAGNQTVYFRPDLRERRFGWFEGKTLEEVRKTHPDRAERLLSRDPSYDVHGGESLISFYQRAVGALRSISQNHQAGEHLLVVTHGGVLDCVQRWARGLALDTRRDFEILNTSLNRISIQGEHCRIDAWAQIGHLR
ncbi:MAG: histidine phosphatase family protein [Burkholderiaceae bacterium]